MATRGRGARAKGANFERALAKIITNGTGIEARRGLAQTRGGGAEVSDVEMPLVHIEAKRHKRCNIKSAMRQAVNDSEANGKIPVVITKDDRQDILVTMKIDDWLPFLKCYSQENVHNSTKDSKTISSDT